MRKRLAKLTITIAILAAALGGLAAASHPDNRGATDSALGKPTGGSAATTAKHVTLVVDGRALQVPLAGATVADLLVARGITIGPRDIVAPAPDTALTDGLQVAVRYARKLTVSVDGAPKSFWTTATTLQGAFSELGLHYAAAARVSVSRSAPIGRQGLALTVRTPKKVAVVVGQTVYRVTTTGLRVSDALAAVKVQVDANDRVDIPVTAAVRTGSRIEVTKVDVRNLVGIVAVKYPTRQRASTAIEQGESKIVTEGRNGKLAIGYAVTYENGKVVARQRVAVRTLTAPVTEVRLLGAKPKAKPKTEPNPETRPQSTEDPPISNLDKWNRIAECESGGNWSINTGNGYYGGLQFDHQTWIGYGGGKYADNAHQATKAQQIEIASKVVADRGGYGAWPVCGKR